MASKFRNLIAVNIASRLKSANTEFNTPNREIAAQLKVKLDKNQARIYFQSPRKVFGTRQFAVGQLLVC